MKTKTSTLLLAYMVACLPSQAQNPIVQTCYTADPAPMVHGDRMYIYIDRDEGPDWFKMNEWRVYSTADMVNWTDHGAALPLSEFAWALEGTAWASQCIERNGKFYWYVCCQPRGYNGHVVGVAVGDSPTGPFHDPLGKPLVEGGWGYIDPSPFIDDDGQAYLYFGNPGVHYVRLNEDMISYSGEVVEIEQDEASFGGPKEPVEGVTYTDLYEEAPWLCKRGDTYYLIYAAGGVPEHIAYSTSHSPTGPWRYAGQIMPLQATDAFTNHSGIVDFRGHSYFVYHTGWLPGGGGFTRSTAVEEFVWNADGTIPQITATREGVRPIATLCPYERVEAETMAWGLGLATAQDSDRGVYVTGIDDGDSLLVREVDFGDTASGVLTFTLRCNTAGGTIEVHLDTKDGPLAATLPVRHNPQWHERSTAITGISGKHDVWFVFCGEGESLFDLDCWQVTPGQTFCNPLVWADFPDPDIIRVGDTFYMVSTTMHMSPGCTLMKSQDLVNWQVIGYAHDQLEELDRFAMKNGESEYAVGSWAANLRYDPYEGLYYVIVTCNSTRKSYIFTSPDIEVGKWHRNEVDMCYDPALLFDDRGTECRKYVVHPNASLEEHEVTLREIISDGKGNVTLGDPTIIIPHGNIENPAQGLRAEGVHAYKVGDYYYIFMIQGVGWQRQEIVWRSTSLAPGTWQVRRVFAGDIVDENGQKYLPFTGVAQGGIVDTPNGDWWCFLFQDYGSVGRIPVLLNMEWSEDGWPIIGNDGTSVNRTLPMPVKTDGKRLFPICSDEFDNGTSRYYPSDTYASDEVTDTEYGFNGSYLRREWQFNHNPDNRYWSLTARPGWLRLSSGSTASNIRHARNTITQRTFGPTSSASTLMDCSGMRDGDVAGLTCWQNQYGIIGVRQENGQRHIIMHKATHKDDAEGQTFATVPLSQNTVYLRVDCDFTDRTDKAYFYYSLDGEQWTRLGEDLQMVYDWPDFVGQRFGLFMYSTHTAGGHADFDWFHLSDEILR